MRWRLRICYHMRILFSCIQICLYVFAGNEAASSERATEYEVDGEIVQTVFKRDGSIDMIDQSIFTVFVRDRSWLIRTADHDKYGKTILTRETSLLNDAEICEVWGKPYLGAATNRGSFPNVALIVSNTVPVGENEGCFVSHLWLMFASGQYFANLTTNWLTPVYDVNASVSVNPNLKREAKWVLVNGPGSLPLNVVYINEYNHEIHATYEATGVTNSGTILVPSGFVFEQRVGALFAPGALKPGESIPAYRIRKRTVATVTAVRPVCSRSELLATANGKTIVTDKRLAHAVSPIPVSIYFARTGVQWVSVEAAKKVYIKNSASRKTTKHSLAVFYLMFLVVSAAPLLLLIRKRRCGK